MGKVKLTTRESVNEQRAFKQICLTDTEKRTLLDEMGYFDLELTKPKMKSIIKSIEKVLGEYFQAKVAVDQKPRPAHARRRCQNINNLASRLLKELGEADPYSLSALIKSGYREKAHVSGFITDQFGTLEHFLKELIGLLTKLKIASADAVKVNALKPSRHRKREFATKYLIQELVRVFDSLQDGLTPVEMVNSRIAFINKAVLAANIKLPATWRRQLPKR